MEWLDIVQAFHLSPEATVAIVLCVIVAVVSTRVTKSVTLIGVDVRSMKTDIGGIREELHEVNSKLSAHGEQIAHLQGKLEGANA